MSNWLDKIMPSKIRSESRQRTGVPEGLWKKCPPKCGAFLYKPELEKNLDVCPPKCNHHLRVSARRRLDIFLDKDGREELAAHLEPSDRLKFKDSKRYKDRLAAAQKATGEKDALIAMRGTTMGVPLVACAFEFNFLGGSMGQVVGEKFVQAANVALEHRIPPLVCFSASGGARMQEAILSLMQMAKTAAVLEKLKQEGIPYISVMTDPVFGGVSASLAMLGDLNIAEPYALIGFAGRGLSSKPCARNCRKVSSAANFCWNMVPLI